MKTITPDEWISNIDELRSQLGGDRDVTAVLDGIEEGHLFTLFVVDNRTGTRRHVEIWANTQMEWDIKVKEEQWGKPTDS